MPGMQPDAAEMFIRLVFNGDGDDHDTEEETDDVPTEKPEPHTDETLEDDR